MPFGVLGLFGMVPFTCSDSSVLTFRNLNESRSARYASHMVLGAGPVHEYIGQGAATVSFNISMRTQFGSNPSIYLPMLKALLETGQAQTLMLGTEYFGEYILTGYSTERKYYSGEGICISADVSLQLTEAATGTSLIGAVAGAAAGALGGAINSVTGTIEGAVSGAVGAVTGAVGGAVNSVTDAIGSTMNTAVGTVDSMIDSVTGAVSSTFGEIKEAAGDVIEDATEEGGSGDAA